MTLQIIDQVHIDTNSAISLLTEHGPTKTGRRP